MDKFKNKYRITSHRKPDWDYSANALYFLTLVTQNRECNLAEIVNPGNQAYSQLLNFGEIIEQEWFKSFDIRKELISQEFVIMPNHLHSIVEIRNTRRDTRPCVSIPNQINDNAVNTRPCVSIPNQINDGVDNAGDTRPCVSTLPITRNPPIRLPKSISSFIAGFKSGVNTKINDFIDQQKLSIPKYNRNNHFFQGNYHDHIIRNQIEYENISNYIKNNPAKWIDDKFNKSTPP